MPQKPLSNSIGLLFTVLETVDSTNKYAMGLIHAEMARHGEAIFSYAKPGGKGQRGKTWSSIAGANILLSVIIKPEGLKLTDQFFLNAAVSIAAHDFFKKYAGEETKIKWPNDLYWRDRKAGGILVESSVRSSNDGINNQESAIGNWQWAVVGLGININQTIFPDNLPNPVSLKQITGYSYDPVQLAKELCDCLNEQFNLLISGEKESILKRYNLLLYKLNEKVKLKKDNRVFEVVIHGVSSSGKLMTTHAVDKDPIAIGFGFGEVEWVIEQKKLELDH